MSSSTYDLQSLRLPRLTGTALRIFTNILETGLGRFLLLKSLLKNAGIVGFRKLHATETPTFLPLYPAGSRRPPGGKKQRGPYRLKSNCDGFVFPSAQDYHLAYITGRTNPLEIAGRAIQMIRLSDEQTPPLRAVIAFDEQDIYSQAQASALRYKNSKPLGILDGVPVVIKDEFDQVPYPTTVGTKFLGQSPATSDATVVARMRSAGAILIGKGNMHEIGIGVSGINTIHGTARNPYRPMHQSGGSSSGPAAAVASALSPIAIGADGGGSIRIPAAFCGVYGLKATFSRISEYGAAPLCWSVAHNGPLAATVNDLVLAYAAIAGPDKKDPLTLSQPPVTLPDSKTRQMKNIVLGVYWPWFRHAEAPIVAACENTLTALQNMGAKIQEIILPELEALRVAHTITISSEMNAAIANYYRHHRRDLNYDTRINLALSRTFSARDYLLAQRIRTRAIAHFAAALEKVHAIITPTTACVAPRISPTALNYNESDLTTLVEVMRFSVAANFTGLPAISFPVGYSADGLPIGMQAIGRPWTEDALLAIAHAAAGILQRLKPQRYYSLLEDFQ